MEFFDYENCEEECIKILEDAEPCEECGEAEFLALVVVTSEDNFGSLLIFCTDCSSDGVTLDPRRKGNEILYV